MMTTVRRMVTCRWAARRIQRYLDADPAAPLGPAEVTRLEAHMADCARCTGRAAEYRELGRALRSWSDAHGPDPARFARLHAAAQRISSSDPS